MRSVARRVGVGLLIAALAAVSVAVASAAVAKHPKKPKKPLLSISVLSGRADLVSGGSALVAITLPGRADAKQRQGHRRPPERDEASSRSARTGTSRVWSPGLNLGRNVLQATLKSGWAARITLVNHPSSGPVFAGPQLKPWTCQTGATDKQCDQPPTFTYLYKSTNPAKTGFQPYDPNNPPSDVAQTTTDQGVHGAVHRAGRDRLHGSRPVPDRGARSAEQAVDARSTPQRQFDHKLLITHGVVVRGRLPDRHRSRHDRDSAAD